MLLFSDLLIWLNLYDDQIACQCWCWQSANTWHTKLKSGASNLHGAGASNLQDNNTAAEIGKSQNESRDQVFRYIRLTYLIPELLDKVDGGIIALSPAVELSYLSEKQQKTLLDAMRLNDCTPSHAQSIRMKKQAQQNTLSSDSIYEFLTKPRKPE